jgi:hypothetical protein
MSMKSSVLSLRAGVRRAAFWSAAAVLATGLSYGCGGGGDENADIYEVTVSVLSTTDLNSVHFRMRGFFNDGDWVGHGDDLDCRALVDADIESEKFGNDPGQGTVLELRLSNEDSFPAPNEIVVCDFRTSEEFRGITECDENDLPIFDIGYFCIELLDATNAAGSPTNATIDISVERRQN